MGFVKFGISLANLPLSRAFKYYTIQRWDEALEIFNELMRDYPADYVTKVYVARCEQYKVNPPGADWNMSTTLTEK
jgi:adenylate cyclase